MKFFSILLSFILLLQFFSVFGQDAMPQSQYSFMFYNCENFFDCENDSLTADDEFTPEGARHWTWQHFNDKTNRIAKVIAAAGQWNAPILVGLCEIENLQVVQKLAKSAALATVKYKIIHKDSPDERGIDVALIYRSEFFKPFDYRLIPVTLPADPDFKTRDILEVSGVLNNCDTLCVFINHWPSKYKGVMETNRSRELAARTLKNAVGERVSKMPSAKMICMGDFNDTPEDESVKKILQATQIQSLSGPGDLINLSAQWKNKAVQTIKSGYSWQAFDQWIVSANFITDTTCCSNIKAEIFSPEFLLEPDKKFGGVKPRRTYNGFSYQEGFSDHLPILLRFRFD